MRFSYKTEKGTFETNDIYKILMSILHTDNDEPSLKDNKTGYMAWHKHGSFYRDNGPVIIFEDGTKYFEINKKAFLDLDDWLKNHPNQSEEFQNEMQAKWGN